MAGRIFCRNFAPAFGKIVGFRPPSEADRQEFFERITYRDREEVQEAGGDGLCLSRRGLKNTNRQEMTGIVYGL